MKTVLNIISLVASFTVAVMGLYFIQYYTLGLIPQIKKITYRGFYVKDFVFVFVALIIILLFFQFYLPY